jgi:crotonobetainyl-CoA:carnitine CoA-transferase CaiB-like acyl-CoA transferase
MAGKEAMLSPYRALDLTDEKGLLCGKILGDLGADVIKIEKPGGDAARSIGPFYHDDPDPEKSLFWFAYNTSKRGITLDIESPAGKDLFKRLVKTADFVIESFPVGYMESLGLGYADLEKINPRVIMVSITPFGKTGPYKDFKTSDIVAWALGGYMYTVGDPERGPARVSHHSQAYLHAGGRGAVGAMLALYHREMTGEGQQVDVTVQEAVAAVSIFHTPYWDMLKTNSLWSGELSGNVHRMRQVWPCKDGYVVYSYWGGSEGMRRSRPLVEWMESEGMSNEFLSKFDWSKFNTGTASQETVESIETPTIRFFMSHTKKELLEGAVKFRSMLYPVSTAKDIAGNAQLEARQFWADMEHPGLGVSLRYPGGFAHCTETSPAPSRRAPMVGEHNLELYRGELGLKDEELAALRQSLVI